METKTSNVACYVPSEFLEPAITKFLGTIIREIGSYSQCPPTYLWRRWSYMLRGVAYLIDCFSDESSSSLSARPVHAILAYNNVRGEFDPFNPYGVYDPQRAVEIWRRCRDSLE